jgi:hypothetical protein
MGFSILWKIRSNMSCKYSFLYNSYRHKKKFRSFIFNGKIVYLRGKKIEKPILVWNARVQEFSLPNQSILSSSWLLTNLSSIKVQGIRTMLSTNLVVFLFNVFENICIKMVYMFILEQGHHAHLCLNYSLEIQTPNCIPNINETHLEPVFETFRQKYISLMSLYFVQCKTNTI